MGSRRFQRVAADHVVTSPINASADYESQSSYKIRLASTDSAGNSVEQSFSLAVNDIDERIVSLTPDATSVAAGDLIAIPITIDNATGLQFFDLNINVDPNLFEVPSSISFAESGSITSDWTVSANLNSTGSITLSGFSPTPLGSGSGSIAVLNLKAKDYAVPGIGSIDLFASSLNEESIGVEMVDTSLTVTPASFRVFEVSAQPYGLALRLSRAPDLDAFNLYDGQDASMDVPDLQLTSPSAQPVALSAHWHESSNELLLFADEPLTDGSYTLKIDSRADGLISASAGELLDGNGDGTGGDAFSTSFTYTAPEHSLSIANTARGAGQSLNLNGRNTHDSLTGAPLADSNGLPIHLSTSSSITSLSGSLSFDSSLLLADALTTGADLPDDWILSVDPSSPAGTLIYSASGTTAITGDDQEILCFHATVAADAAPPARGTTGNGLYGSSTLINASLTSDQLTGDTIAIDPGLVVLAYSGDTTGNGTLSSLDASRVQRVVVGLDSGFDAYDDLNPVLLGDTTGNGTLSSLDASCIQQQVVGLPVDSFPDLPDTPINDPLG